MQQQTNQAKQHTSKSSLVALAVAAVLSVSSVGFPAAASASSMANDYNMNQGSGNNQMMSGMNGPQTYISYVRPLNGSNVSGQAQFVLDGRNIMTTINLEGLEPGLHPQHIHGKEQAMAECPDMSADTNNDGFISVVEGAPAYGPIKLNLTSPQTDPGTPPTAALFTPFAGTPDNNNFPSAGADGRIHFQQTYTFDTTEVADAAFRSVQNLGDQHYVVHGGTAPLGVDADAFAALGAPRAEGYNPNERAYDVLLPTGCGEIDKQNQQHDNSGQNNDGGQAHHQNGQDNSQAQHQNGQQDQQDNSVQQVNSQNSGGQGGQQGHDNTQNNDQNNGGDNNGGQGDDNSGMTHDQVNAHIISAQNNMQSHFTEAMQLPNQSDVDMNAFRDMHMQYMNDFNASVQAARDQYTAHMSAGMNHDEARNHFINALAAARDHQVNRLYEARNQMVDKLNQHGNVENRDYFLHHVDAGIEGFNRQVEDAKNQL